MDRPQCLDWLSLCRFCGWISMAIVSAKRLIHPLGESHHSWIRLLRCFPQFCRWPMDDYSMWNFPTVHLQIGLVDAYHCFFFIMHCFDLDFLIMQLKFYSCSSYAWSKIGARQAVSCRRRSIEISLSVVARHGAFVFSFFFLHAFLTFSENSPRSKSQADFERKF